MIVNSVVEPDILGEVKPRRFDAVTLLSSYTFLLVLIPSPLIFEPLGAAGSVAEMFADMVFICYLIVWLHPVLAPARGYQPVRRAAIAFACAIIATYVSVNRHAMPTLELNGADRGVILLCGWLGVMLLAADGIDSMDRLKVLIRRIVIGATTMGALAAVQFFTGLNAVAYIVIPGLTRQYAYSDLGTRDALNRPTSTALTAIELAAVMAMCLPLAIHQARFAPPGRRMRCWLQAAVIGATLPMTVSRTAVVAIAAVVVVILPTWTRRERLIAYLVGIGSIAIMWATIPGLVGTFTQLFAAIGSDTSTTSRTGAFQAAAPFIDQHPWLGHGFQTFFPQTYFFTDDQYLLSLIETGVIGLLALLSLFVAGWFTARSARRASSDAQTRDLAQCLAAALAAAAVSFGTFDAFSFSIISGLTFILLGCAGAVWRLTHAQRQAVSVGADQRAGDAVH
jgi:O-antigen ligase